MSKYEWERGSIIIPTAVWSSFRRTIIEKWNAEQERLFKLAVEWRAKVDAAAKGKRNFDRVEWLRNAMNARCWGANGESAASEDCDAVLRLIGLSTKMVDGKWVTPSKTSAPKRKDLKILPVSRGATLPLGEATIKLDDETRTVHWSVGENNHACETARSLPIARALFRELDKVEWTRGSGGKIVGNDEYNRDNDEEGGGSNYVTGDYGPHVKKVAPSSSSTYGYGFGYGRSFGGRY